MTANCHGLDLENGKATLSWARKRAPRAVEGTLQSDEVRQCNLAPGLYVVATPIGNLGDFSQRAIDVLRRCDLLACEDTRVTGKLLKHFSIGAKLISCREENELEMATVICDAVASGKLVALVCDAGTPLVSDPGFRVVRQCRRRGLPVFPIPGPSAAIAALSASGLPSNSFLFLGFPPNKSTGRRQLFSRHKSFPATIIFYESCHRIRQSLSDALEEFGENRYCAVGREITKLHESWHVGKLCEVYCAISSRKPLGEYVLLIAADDFTL